MNVRVSPLQFITAVAFGAIIAGALMPWLTLRIGLNTTSFTASDFAWYGTNYGLVLIVTAFLGVICAFGAESPIVCIAGAAAAIFVGYIGLDKALTIQHAVDANSLGIESPTIFSTSIAIGNGLYLAIGGGIVAALCFAIILLTEVDWHPEEE